MHELCHFLFFEKCKEIFPNWKYEDFDSPSILWYLSEIVVDPILNSNDIQKWVDRLNISITMPGQTRYFTKAQVNALLKDGANYLVGLDSATSYEISAWLDNHITTKNTLFIDANGHDRSETTNTNAYTKQEIKSLISVEFKKLLGAQYAKTKN